MECTEVREELRDWSRGSLMPSEARAHLEACGECGDLWRQERELTAALAGMRTLPGDASAAVKAAVLAALPSVPSKPPAAAPWRQVMAMAAVVLLTAVAGWYLARRPAAQVGPSSKARPSGRQVHYTDFFPLSRRALDHDEPAQLVRIRLPRREMRRFGLPVTEEFERSPVEADVVIGQDGIARAVRFVSPSQ